MHILADTNETKQQEIQNVCRRNGIICVTGSCLETIIIIIIVIVILRLDIQFFQAYNYAITVDTTKYASV